MKVNIRLAPHGVFAYLFALSGLEGEKQLTRSQRTIRLVSDQFKKGEIMEKIGAYEAKTHLAQLLQRVSKGEKITITKHGVPVATLQAPDANLKCPTAEVIAELRKFRQKHRLGKLSIRNMIEEGRH